MDRSERILIVLVAALGLVMLFVAFFAAPFVAIMSMPGPSELETSMPRFIEVARIANNVSLVCLSIAAGCGVYLLVQLAIWFIGPRDETSDRTA